MHKFSNETSLLLDSIFLKYHNPDFIHPDPLEFLDNFKNKEDIEIAGLIASSFAIGRVQSILKTVNGIFDILKSPKKYLLNASRDSLKLDFNKFKYRFYTENSLVDFLLGIKNVLIKFGSLHNCYLEGVKQSGGDPLGSLTFFVTQLTVNIGSGQRVLPDPSKGSACKRLNLFLRWMIRNDVIDPGIWSNISKDLLIIPLDTHMMQISHILGFTSRNSADMKTAIEITTALKLYDPVDPVRFDFSLTRLGIHPDLNYDELYKKYKTHT